MLESPETWLMIDNDTGHNLNAKFAIIYGCTIQYIIMYGNSRLWIRILKWTWIWTNGTSKTDWLSLNFYNIPFIILVHYRLGTGCWTQYSIHFINFVGRRQYEADYITTIRSLQLLIDTIESFNPLTYDLRSRILGRKRNIYVWPDHRTRAMPVIFRFGPTIVRGLSRHCRLRG